MRPLPSLRCKSAFDTPPTTNAAVESKWFDIENPSPFSGRLCFTVGCSLAHASLPIDSFQGSSPYCCQSYQAFFLPVFHQHQTRNWKNFSTYRKQLFRALRSVPICFRLGWNTC